MKAGRRTSGLGRSLLLALALVVVLLAISWVPWPGQSADGKLSVQAWGYRYDDRDPQIAVDDSGNSYVVWERYTPDVIDDVDVYWRHVNSDGTLGAVLNLADPLTDNGLNEYRPRIDVDFSGNSYVVWYGQTRSPGGLYGTPWVDPDFEVFWQRVAPDGTTLGDPLQLTDNDRDDLAPEIAVDILGNSSVIWRGWTASDWDIYWQRLTTTGTPTATSPRNITSNGRDDRNPHVDVDFIGSSYVVWESQRYIGRGDFEIYWQNLDADGFRVAGSTNLSNSPGQDDAPQIAVDELTGNSFVVWQGRNGRQWDIYWRMVPVPSSGAPIVDQCYVGSQLDLHLDLCNLNSDYATGTDFSDSFPQVAVDTQGNSYVVWEGHDYRDTDIYWRRVSFDGSASGVVMLSDFPGHYYQNDHAPQIAVDSKGNSYVVWQGSDGYESEIYWRRVNADGTLSPVVQITDNRRHPDRVPVVGIDPGGNSKVAYQGWDGISWAVWWRQVSEVSTMSATVALFPTPTPTPIPWIP